MQLPRQGHLWQTAQRLWLSADADLAAFGDMVSACEQDGRMEEVLERPYVVLWYVMILSRLVDIEFGGPGLTCPLWAKMLVQFWHQNL